MEHKKIKMDIQSLFVATMKDIARSLDRPVYEITKAQFFSNNDAISEWDLRKVGGFTNLKRMYFPSEENLEVKHGSRLMSMHRSKLEKQYGEYDFIKNEFIKDIKEVLSLRPLKLHPPVKPKKKSPTKRTLVAHLSDTHYGSNISKEEVMQVNEYNWTIAARRTALFAEEVISYKSDHRKETDLVLCLNGDILAGIIHNQEWFVDLLTTQFLGSLSVLSQMISFLANHFNHIKVICSTGNHGRSVGKSDRGNSRALTHKWDSYESMLYISLKHSFREYKNVEFMIPESPMALFEVQGHSFGQTHGDTVVNVGNLGKSLNIKNINDQINKINTSLMKNKKLKALLVGHVHTPTIQLTQSGCMLIINGCLSGTDPYAQSVGIFESNPSQLLFESTPEYPVGDIRIIHVKGADSQSRLDKIIEPFKGSLGD